MIYRMSRESGVGSRESGVGSWETADGGRLNAVLFRRRFYPHLLNLHVWGSFDAYNDASRKGQQQRRATNIASLRKVVSFMILSLS